MMTVGTSMALADAPDSIYIDPNAESKSDVVTFIKDEANNGKPEIWMKKDGTWTLVNSKNVLATECPECGSSIHPGTPECPECGTALP